MKEGTEQEAPGEAGADRIGDPAETLTMPHGPPASIDEPGADTAESRNRGRLTRGCSVGRFLILERIGQGAMGEVYCAYDPDLDRKIALKILRPGREGRRDLRLRLGREAKALARLDHPNVVKIFDVGTAGDQVYLAMEWIPGLNLRDHLAQDALSAEAVLDLFREAGRGLAAAHESDLIHRDFKPANVMVGLDGRVRVLDFGLARPNPGDSPHASSGRGVGSRARSHRQSIGHEGAVLDPTALGLAPSFDPEIEDHLTQTGATLGTPAYMAPEQRRGEAATTASDQFGFGAALFEALHGMLPYPGLTSSLDDGPWALAAPSPRPDVRPEIQRAIERSVAPDVADRYASMSALLGALAPPKPRQRSGRIVAILLSALAIVTVFAFRSSRPAAALCTGGPAQLAGVWNDDRSMAVRQRAQATLMPDGVDRIDRAAGLIDSYGKAWVAAYGETCRATQIEGTQSPALLDLRMACLETRMQSIDTLADVLETVADAAAAEKALRGATRLAGLDACRDRSALLAMGPPPDDPDARATLDSGRKDLARARVLMDIGNFDGSQASATAALEKAARIGSQTLLAEATVRLGIIARLAGEDSEAVTNTLESALIAAAAGRHDRVAAEALVELVRVTGYERNDFEAASAFARQAETVIRRLTEPDLLQARLDDQLGTLASRQGDYEAALTHHEAARQRLDSARDVPPQSLLAPLDGLANALAGQGLYEEARQVRLDLLERQEALLGPEHPQIAISLNQLGNGEFDRARFGAAETAYRRARAIRQRVFGDDHVRTASVEVNLANALAAGGRPHDALVVYRQAQITLETRLGADHPHVAVVLSSSASALNAIDDRTAARQRLERALAIQEKAFGRDHSSVGQTHYNLADLAFDDGDADVAVREFRAALRIWEAAHGPDHPRVAAALSGIGRATLLDDRAADALPWLMRALEIRDRVESDPWRRATTRFASARALAASGRDPEKARYLATEADRELDDADDRAEVKDLRAAIRQWLDRQGES